MDLSQPSLSMLFAQLGLANDNESIDQFIDTHRGLNQSLKLHNAPFWNAAQSKFLEDALNDDATWAEVIDQLNSRLR